MEIVGSVIISSSLLPKFRFQISSVGIDFASTQVMDLISDGNGMQHPETSSVSYNTDILCEILKRLCSKSLMRFKSVCKDWCDLISSKYFCSLWQQHHNLGGPKILLTSRTCDWKYGVVDISDPSQGALEMSSSVREDVCRSSNGVLVHLNYNRSLRKCNYWVSNPATTEVVHLAKLLIDCKVHVHRTCTCCMGIPIPASDGKVFALAACGRRRGGFRYQVCVYQKQQGGWRSMSKPFGCKTIVKTGHYWRNFVVWVGRKKTWFYKVDQVEGEAMIRTCRSPRQRGIRCRELVCGGNLCLVHVEERNDHGRDKDSLVIHEMKHDLSGWFVKHRIRLSRIRSSLLKLIGWKEIPRTLFPFNCLIVEKADSKSLVLRCENEVVLYDIRQHKGRKLCDWDFGAGSRSWPDYFEQHMHHFSHTIAPFQ